MTNNISIFDGVHSALGLKAPVRVRASSEIALSGLQTIDGVVTTEDMRVLVTGQSDSRLNGIYNASSGLWSRAADFDGNRDIANGTLVFVTEENLIYRTVVSGSSVVIGTSNIAFQLVFGQIDNGYNVQDYGAIGDGLTDDTAAIQAAIDAVEAVGGGTVRIPAGIYVVSSTITIDDCGVNLVGDGGGWAQSGSTAERGSSATRIKWGGGASPVIKFTSVAGAEPRVGGGMEDILVDGNEVATYGVQILSFRGLKFRGVFTFATVTSGWWTGAISGALSASPYDTQHCLFDTCRSDNKNLASTGYGVMLTGGQGNGGTASGNSSFNTFINCEFGANSNYSVRLEGTDNNRFIACHAGGNGVILGSADENSSGAASPGAARFNSFFGCELAAVVCKAAQSGGESSHDNVFMGISRSNGATLPTFESGGGGSSNATGIVYSTNEISGSAPVTAKQRLRMEARLSVAESSGQATNAEAEASTLAIGSGSSNHIALTNGTEKWAININSANGNLRVSRNAGTGFVFIGNDTQINGRVGFNGSAVLTKPSITGSRGGNAALASLLTALANYGLITDSTTA